MTITVTVKHEGPGHHDVKVTSKNPHAPTEEVNILKAGEQVTLTIWDNKSLVIEEQAQ